MNQFSVDNDLCSRCGLCAQTCPVGVLRMDGLPVMDEGCLGCGQCLAVCPRGAVTVGGRTPGESRLLKDSLPDPHQVATLIKGRRSIRKFQSKPVAPELIKTVVDTAWHAPTGVNTQSVLPTVITDFNRTAAFRDEVYARIEDRLADDAAPETPETGFLKWALEERKTSGKDLIFRNAPHILVASAPKDKPSPLEDTLIFLSYFELAARAHDLGTCWNGMLKSVINDVFPEFRARLGIPEDHLIGYAMTFGHPGVRYRRTVERGPAPLNAAVWEAV